MIENNYDIFTGANVNISISNIIDPVVSFHDPSFIDIPHVASFPEINATREMSRIETYDSDTESILPGTRTYQDTEITVSLIPEDPAQQMLEDALDSKQLLRFRMFYHIDTVQDNSPGQEGYYRIFDGYVLSENTQGETDTAMQKTYQIAIEKMYDAGVARKGDPLLTGDYGIGAGTTDYPGVLDWNRLSGNRFVTFPGSSAQNPFGVDTGGIAVQGNDNQGWQMLVNSSGKPLIRVRNLAPDHPQNWVRVFSSEEKPTAADVQAVSLKGDVMTGALYSPEIRGTTFRFCPVPGEANEAGLPRYIQTTNAAGEAVTIATMRHASGKGYFDVDYINAPTRLTEQGHRVYSDNNKPTPATLSAVNVRGDTMSGALKLPKLEVETTTTPSITLTSTDTAINRDRGTVALSQSTQGNFAVAFQNPTTNVILSRILFEAGKSGTVYHTGNKPTAADIGAIDHNDVIDLGTF